MGQKQRMLGALWVAIELYPEFKVYAKIYDYFQPYREDEDFRTLVYGEEQ